MALPTLAVPDKIAPEIAAVIQFKSSLLSGWHLWSLDAPTVACLWIWFALRAGGRACPPWLLGGMALAVWVLYAGDRLLDARVISDKLEARHFFHRRHRGMFLGGICLALPLLTALLPLFETRLLAEYGVLAVLLLLWFGWIHRAGTGRPLPVPKEAVVGIFFATAVFLPVVLTTAGGLPAAVLFAVLLLVNGLFIRVWEQGFKSGAIVRATSCLAMVCCVSAGAGLLSHRSWLPATACALSCGLFVGLDRRRGCIERTTLRAAVDAALLTPLLLLPFLPR